jgi:large subunit ribosomal protein L5
MEQFGYRNRMAVPRLEKIVVSRGIGAANQDKRLLEQAVEELTLITGQKAILTYAKKDISNFKLRRGMPIGVKVTLRHFRMYEFLDRLINLALPRTKDFRGLPTESFDGFGNYTLGIQEQIVFPEIDVDKVYKIMGMDITIVTTAKTDEEGFALLKGMGMPFKGEAQLV